MILFHNDDETRFRKCVISLTTTYLGGKPPYFCENRHGLL